MPRRWPGETIFIIAGGPSVTQAMVDALKGRHVIAINSSYEKAPWADYVFAMDYRWTGLHRPTLKKDFLGRFVTTTRMEHWPGIRRLRKILKPGLSSAADAVNGSKTSLTAAIGLAVHLVGPGSIIVILGADGGKGKDGKTHHHTPHPWRTQPSAWEHQAKELQTLVRPLKELGIKIVNASPESKWGYIFPAMALDDFLKNEGERMDKRAEDYAVAFARERAQVYPAIDVIEAEAGFAIDRRFLEEMAEPLACPVKANPPNWQHGRVLYALARRYLFDHEDSGFFFLDIGTAKGFSALCMAHALADAEAGGRVVSLDVIDPEARIARNSVAELDGLKTIAELVAPFWPRPTMQPVGLEFKRVAGMTYLAKLPTDERINFAFIDGKHKTTDVREEAREIRGRQFVGDIVVFDDMHLPPVAAGAAVLAREYDMRTVKILPNRHYAVAVKR